jgi:hypothetical protein
MVGEITMKSVYVFLISVFLAFGVAACGGSDNGGDTNVDDGGDTNADDGGDANVVVASCIDLCPGAVEASENCSQKTTQAECESECWGFGTPECQTKFQDWVNCVGDDGFVCDNGNDLHTKNNCEEGFATIKDCVGK